MANVNTTEGRVSGTTAAVHKGGTQTEQTRALASAVVGQISSVLYAQQKRPQMFSESLHL